MEIAGAVTVNGGYTTTGQGSNGVSYVDYNTNGVMNLKIVGNNGNNEAPVRLYKNPDGSFTFAGYTGDDYNWMLGSILGQPGSKLSNSQLNQLRNTYGIVLDTTADSSLPGVVQKNPTGGKNIDKDGQTWTVSGSDGKVAISTPYNGTGYATVSKNPDNTYSIKLSGTDYLFGQSGFSVDQSKHYSESEIQNFANNYGVTLN